MRRVRWGHRETEALSPVNELIVVAHSSSHQPGPLLLQTRPRKRPPAQCLQSPTFSDVQATVSCGGLSKAFWKTLMVPQDERGREPCDLSAETTHSSLEKKQRAGALTWVKLHRCLGLGMYSPPFLSFQTRESYWQKLYLKTNAIVQS